MSRCSDVRIWLHGMRDDGRLVDWRDSASALSARSEPHTHAARGIPGAGAPGMCHAMLAAFDYSAGGRASAFNPWVGLSTMSRP